MRLSWTASVTIVTLAGSASSFAACAHAQTTGFELDAASGATSRTRSRIEPAQPSPIASLDERACYALLDDADVQYTRVSADDAPGVAMPIRLEGPLGGVVIEPRDGNPTHATLDCRLAAALLAWAPALREAGVNRIQHYSIYRPNSHVRGGAHVSGHAHGLAIDSALYRLDDGRVLDVLADWGERAHGDDPCAPHDDATEGARLLRQLVCSAVQAHLFEVVLTPHFDAAHQNHVHLEVLPGVTWAYVH